MGKKELLVKHKHSVNLLIRTVGNSLIILSLFFLSLGFWPYISAEIKYNLDQLRGQKYVVKGDSTVTASSGPAPVQITPINNDFAIVIPKIDVNANVTADVDPTSYNAYARALAKGAAHARGTVYPGQHGNSYIFAHSSLNFWDIYRYNSVFTLLRKVEVSDLVAVFYKGKRYDYTVVSKKIVPPTDTSVLTAKADGNQLTLQTCDPPGLNLNRLVVIAKEN
jgi:LPXTG-site transpeptidase (sortase) family protein